jgi:hypothetical protein
MVKRVQHEHSAAMQPATALHSILVSLVHAPGVSFNTVANPSQCYSSPLFTAHRFLRRVHASSNDAARNGWVQAQELPSGMPLQAAVLSARLLYGAGLSCFCARMLHDANQSSSIHHDQHSIIASALLSRCRCDAPLQVIRAAAAFNATLSFGMPSLQLLLHRSPSVILPALTLYDSMSWQVSCHVVVVVVSAAAAAVFVVNFIVIVIALRL